MLRNSVQSACTLALVFVLASGNAASADTLAGGASSLGVSPSTWVLGCAGLSAMLGVYFRQRRRQASSGGLAGDFAAGSFQSAAATGQ